MLQGIICIVGIILFMRMYPLKAGDFLDHPHFAQARGRYLYAYAFLALGTGIPILLAWFWQFFYLPTFVQSFKDAKAAQGLAETIGIFSFVCYGLALLCGVTFHIAAQRLDHKKILYYEAIGKTTRPKTDAKNLLKKTNKFD
jgi:Na+/proline symporter